MLKAVLFDLDGTLLPMKSLDDFIKAYLGGITKHLSSYGYNAELMMKSIWGATLEVMKNSGECTNEQLFWEAFSKYLGNPDIRLDEPKFNEFYIEHFDEYKAVCGFDPKAAVAVKSIKGAGLRTVLATNPVFPHIATKKRMQWAGVSEDDFDCITTYENSHYCKPSLNYYRELLEKLGLRADECLMVGNDTDDDMVARELGMGVYLVPRYLINKRGKDINQYPRGTFDELVEFVKTQSNDN